MSAEKICAFRRKDECGIAGICAGLIIPYKQDKQGVLDLNRHTLSPQLIDKLKENGCVVPIYACAVQAVKDGSLVTLSPCLVGIKGVEAKVENCQYFVPAE